MNNKTLKISYIDIFKALAIITVIIGHINFANQGIKEYLYSFSMPLFFFIYGVIYNFKINKENYNYKLKQSIQSKFKSILIPYTLWAIIFSELNPINLIYIIYGSHQTLNINSNSSLWFLPCYFISTIIFEIIINITQKASKSNKNKFNIISIIISILFIILSLLFPIINSLYGCPWSINTAFMGISFMLIGMIVTNLINKIFKISYSKLIILLIIMFLGTLIYSFNDNIKYVLMAENIYGNLLIFLITSLCGCGLITCLSIIIDRLLKGKIKQYISFLGQNTLVIFATHKTFIAIIHILLDLLPFNMSKYIMLAITTIISIIGCSIAIIIINTYIPELNGKTLTIKKEKSN